MKTSLETLGGRVKSIGCFYHGQNSNGIPDHYVSIVEARRLNTLKRARFINRGTSLLITGLRDNSPKLRDSQKRGWKVVGQTPKNGLKPGFPRWSSV